MKKPKKIKPTPYIDLHGYHIHAAFKHCQNRIELYKMNGYKTVEVITGKSGLIRQEFPIWLETWGLSGSVSKHNGSFIVNIKGRNK
jgi:DNA-nicking Smr family endonuclease